MVDKRNDLMKYKITTTDFYLKKGVDRIFDLEINGKTTLPDDLVTTLVSIPIIKLPLFFDSVVNKKAFCIHEYTWIIFGEELDENNNILVPKNAVGIFVMDECKLMEESEFYNICNQLAIEAIHAFNLPELKKYNIFPHDWLQTIEPFKALLRTLYLHSQ